MLAYSGHTAITLTTPGTTPVTHGPFGNDNTIIAARPHRNNLSFLIVFHKSYRTTDPTAYVTHIFNTYDSSFNIGHYFKTYDAAYDDFMSR
jgi:hypothetical protein